MKKLISVLLLTILSYSAFAHPGGLDSNGGHTDKKTGTYHYHRKVSAPASAPAPAPVIKPIEKPETAQISESSTEITVYVTKTGEKYHLAGCTFLSKSSIPISLENAISGYSPCSRCNPPTSISGSGSTESISPSIKASKQEIQSFSGKVVAITDGDTIKVLRDGKQVAIRLNGIDCPESSQAFGQRAKQYCSELAFGTDVLVRILETDKYQRLVCDITLSDGRSLNSLMISGGMAWHYKEYSKDQELARLESEARKSRVGLWVDQNPIPPWDFRK